MVPAMDREGGGDQDPVRTVWVPPAVGVRGGGRGGTTGVGGVRCAEAESAPRQWAVHPDGE